MKKVLLVALVVLLVVIGLPVLMPGMAAHCDDCGPATAAGPLCAFVVLAALAYVAGLMEQRVRLRRLAMTGLLRAGVFDRPPQLA